MRWWKIHVEQVPETGLFGLCGGGWMQLGWNSRQRKSKVFSSNSTTDRQTEMYNMYLAFDKMQNWEVGGKYREIHLLFNLNLTFISSKENTRPLHSKNISTTSLRKSFAQMFLVFISARKSLPTWFLMGSVLQQWSLSDAPSINGLERRCTQIIKRFLLRPVIGSAHKIWTS